MKQLFFIFCFLFGFFSFCIFAADVGSTADSDSVCKPSNKKPRWSKDEDNLLRKGVNQFGSDWERIAAVVKTRKPSNCYYRWVRRLDPTLKHGDWIKEEDLYIVDQRDLHGHRWGDIGAALGRGGDSVRVRYAWLSKGKIKKSKVLPRKKVRSDESYIPRTSWTESEDKLLTDAVNQLGAGKWQEIAEMVQTRSRKQCRDRWLEYLDPTLKHGHWTKAEDNYIVHKFSKHGGKWKKIIEGLPGRSPGAAKNRWNSFLKKRSSEKGYFASTAVPTSASVFPSLEDADLPFSPRGSLSEAEFAAIAARLREE